MNLIYTLIQIHSRLEPIVSLNIERVVSDQRMSITDDLIVEEPLEIRISYHTSHGIYRVMNLAVTMRTPGDDEMLARGFLFTEGIVDAQDDIVRVEQLEENIIILYLAESVAFDADAMKRNFYTTSSCGVCGKASIESIHSETIYLPWKSNFKIDTETLKSLKSKLSEDQSNFRRSGGVHACAFFDSGGDLISIKEDVGRHNAMDKLIGDNPDYPLSDKLVLVSGRASFELVQKASKAGVPMLVSIGAPSSLAVQLAEEQGMCLIGFLKDDRFNIYSRGDRVM